MELEQRWFQSYEPGVPHTIDPDAYVSLIALIESCFQKYAQKPCFTNMGKVLTYQQVDDLTKMFAGFLQNHCMLTPGDRVVIMLPNVLQYPVAMFGALRAGATIVNTNPLYTPRELSHVLQDSGAKCVVVLENFAHVVESALPGSQVEHVIVTEIGDLLGLIKGKAVNFVVKHIKKMVPHWHISHAHHLNETLHKNGNASFKPVTVKSNALAFIQYTSGTTGGSQGVMLTHRNIIANMMQARAWINPFFSQPLEGGIITALPLYHIFSLLANCLTFFGLGLPNILITNPRDIPGFVKELKRQPFFAITGVNTLFNALLNNEEFHTVNFSTLKFCLGGGMAVQKAVAQRWKAVTGVPLIEAYGLTETSPAVTINPFNLKEFNGSIGLPISSTEVKIGDEKGQEVPLGSTGELMVRGPQVMLGYWQQPEKTKQVLDEQGWLRTGDIATMDDKGFVRIVDRKKDIIIVSGFNVYPNEVEDVIAAMPEVREVAVVGVPSEESGEMVKAFVVKKDPALTAAQIIEHCHTQLTGYKIPKIIEFRTELPKTNVGKILRRALRDEQ